MPSEEVSICQRRFKAVPSGHNSALQASTAMFPASTIDMVVLSMAAATNYTEAHLCCCRVQSTVLSTCQPALKPTYHFSTPKLQNSTAAAQTAGAGGRRLSQSLGTSDGSQMAPARIAPGGRRLSQTPTMANGTQASSACNHIAYYQSCGAALSVLCTALQ